MNNRKYQFHFETKQYKNEQDEEISDDLKFNNETSIADFINMTPGARRYYLNALGSVAGNVVFSEKEDIEQCVSTFNSNRGNIKNMFEGCNKLKKLIPSWYK